MFPAQSAENLLWIDHDLAAYTWMIWVVDYVASFVVLAKDHGNSITITHDACMPCIPVTHLALVTNVLVDTIETSSTRAIDDRAAVAGTLHDRPFETW